MSLFELHPRDDQPRCPYCRASLLGEPVVPCSDCGTLFHVECLVEHGGCAIFGCSGLGCDGQVSGMPLRVVPTVVPWDELVREASPWLELGAALHLQDAWGAPSLVLGGPEEEEPPSGFGSRLLPASGSASWQHPSDSRAA